MATVPATAEVQPSGHLSLRPESLFSRTYGRSLFAGRCSQYVPDFVLLGVAQTNFVTDLVADIKSAAVVRSGLAASDAEKRRRAHPVDPVVCERSSTCWTSPSGTPVRS